MITKLDKETLGQIRDAMNDVLKELNSIGVTATVGLIKYGAGGFTMTINGSLLECENGDSGAKVEFERVARALGIPTTWFGKKIQTSRGVATIIAIEPRKRTYPIIVQLADGRKMGMAINSVKISHDV